jgi:hypothetical protein
VSKKLARPVSKVAPLLRAALRELELMANVMVELRTEQLSAEEMRDMFKTYGDRMEVAAGKIRRRMDMLLDTVPAQAALRRQGAADATIRYAATEAVGNELDPVTVGTVEQWLDENQPDSVRDPATIRAALNRIGRLKRNARGRPRKK